MIGAAIGSGTNSPRPDTMNNDLMSILKNHKLVKKRLPRKIVPRGRFHKRVAKRLMNTEEALDASLDEPSLENSSIVLSNNLNNDHLMARYLDKRLFNTTTEPDD